MRLTSYYSSMEKRKQATEDLRSRIGRFHVPEDYIEDWTDEALGLFGHFVILRAEFHLRTREIEYDAYSPLFDVVPKDCIIPHYSIECQRHSDGTVEYRAIRKDQDKVRTIRFTHYEQGGEA